MNTSPIPVYGSLKRYLSGRKYRRLDSGFTVKKNVRVLRLGGNSQRSRKISSEKPKLQLKMKYPKKILGKIREGYIKMMLGLVGKVGYSEDAKHVFGEKRIPRSRPIPSVSQLNDFDKKLVLQVYNSIAASREFVAFSRNFL
ncbi:hypothetical protein NE237_005722 [Protea cynaroides]|uniref:Uncharacterized protein n=1 Tax=Protea cynaroides TaxID=273540 RepID=A0A9Q0KKY9_9MAGN|nr:hypothetical protein NE237_005722 [Protea cynaroides]